MKTLELPRNLSHVRAALYGQPWAITESSLEQICAIVEARAAGEPSPYQPDNDGDESDDELGFDMRQNCAVIPVQGPIFPKANLFTQMSGATSLEELMDSIQTAATLEPNALILDFNSPGGSVTGLFDFCSQLFAAKSGFGCPLIALVNPLCASAAYSIASQCDEIYSSEGGVTGSIGIILKTNNTDRAERNAGNDPVVLRSHELKGAGVGHISANQIADMQRQVMGYMAKFQEAVVRGRPGIDIDSVSTGQTWLGTSANDDDSAQDMGLIDGISTLEQLIADYGDK